MAMTDMKAKGEPSTDEMKSAADLVDEILGAPAPGEQGVKTPEGSKNLADGLGSKTVGEGPPSMEEAKTGETKPDMGGEASMGKLVSVFGDEATAKKAYAETQKMEKFQGKSPDEVAEMLKKDVQTRMDIMSRVAQGDDKMDQEEKDKNMGPGPTIDDLLPRRKKPPMNAGPESAGF